MRTKQASSHCFCFILTRHSQTLQSQNLSRNCIISGICGRPYLSLPHLAGSATFRPFQKKTFPSTHSQTVIPYMHMNIKGGEIPA